MAVKDIPGPEFTDQVQTSSISPSTRSRVFHWQLRAPLDCVDQKTKGSSNWTADTSRYLVEPVTGLLVSVLVSDDRGPGALGSVLVFEDCAQQMVHECGEGIGVGGTTSTLGAISPYQVIRRRQAASRIACLSSPFTMLDSASVNPNNDSESLMVHPPDPHALR